VGLSLMLRFYYHTPASFGTSKPKGCKGFYFYLYFIFISSKMSNAYKGNQRLKSFKRWLVKPSQW
jgi:hypothetical protein